MGEMLAHPCYPYIPRGYRAFVISDHWPLLADMLYAPLPVVNGSHVLSCVDWEQATMVGTPNDYQQVVGECLAM